MPKITVTNKLTVSKLDPYDVSEPIYREGDNRSFISFNSDYLVVNQNRYKEKYVTVYNSEKVSKSDFDTNKNISGTGLDINSIQRNNALYLGCIKNKHIWLAGKGTRPTLLTQTSIIKSANPEKDLTYKFTKEEVDGFTYTKVSPSIKDYLGKLDKSKDSSYSLLPCSAFTICINAAGGGGGRGQCSKGLFAEWVNNKGGGAGAGAFAVLTVNIIKANLTVKLGKRGKKGTSSGGSSDANDTYIYLNDKHILTLCGGKRGYGKQSDGIALGGSFKVGSDMVNSVIGSEEFNTKLFRQYGAVLLSIGSGADGTGTTKVKKSANNSISCLL